MILEQVKLILGDEYKEWYNIVKNILNNPEFLKRKLFKHHEKQSVYDHCVLVSAYAFKRAKKKRVNEKNCAIAGLLHDFYTAAWQYTKELETLDEKYRSNFIKKRNKKKFLEMHGFTHGIDAAFNTLEYFGEYSNEIIISAIRTHMFPLTLFTKYKFPKYKESWIVTMSDKLVTLKDFPKLKEVPKYLGFKKIDKN